VRKLMIAGLAVATLIGAAGASSAQVVVIERYGHWDNTWGAAPPPPMHKWQRWQGHEAEWNGHVHNCMFHKRYDARRDMYRYGCRWVACVD
jgi:hypothetical protein